jgi:hypothetical protein
VVAAHEGRDGDGAPGMEDSRRFAFEHDDAVPVQHGAPLRLIAELVQQGSVGLTEQGTFDHHIAEALDLRRLVPVTGKPQLGA